MGKAFLIKACWSLYLLLYLEIIASAYPWYLWKFSWCLWKFLSYHTVYEFSCGQIFEHFRTKPRFARNCAKISTGFSYHERENKSEFLQKSFLSFVSNAIYQVFIFAHGPQEITNPRGHNSLSAATDHSSSFSISA